MRCPRNHPKEGLRGGFGLTDNGAVELQTLTRAVSEGLEKDRSYTIKPEELNRVWPVSSREQEHKVREFAEAHGWNVFHYSHGVGAVLVKANR